MFCDSCGTQIQAGQSFCQRCGKAIVGVVQPLGSRVARHSQMLGILWIAYSAILILFSFGMLVFFQHIFPVIIQQAIQNSPPQRGGPPPEIVFGMMRPIMHFVTILLFAKGVAGVIAGIGIVQRAEWSRVLTIVLACIGLVSFPFGTALGIYTLWVLLSPNAADEFRQFSHAVSA